MTNNPDGPPLDVERILTTLNRHQVDYLVVGGGAANAYGAVRRTEDFDCLAERSDENLARLGRAMRDLNARLRVGGLTDEESQQLPVRLDADALQAMQVSTWRTDAGDFDVLADMPDRQGQRLRYEDLAPRAVTIRFGNSEVRVAALEDIIASKEWADRPKDHDALPELHAINSRRGTDPPEPAPS